MALKGKTIKAILFMAFLAAGVSAWAQSGNAYGEYSPYTVFGLGDIFRESTAASRGMGGVGIASRNRRFINITNPAAVTALDSCSFMLDFGMVESNKYFAQNIGGSRHKSVNNTFNISNLAISFPIYRSSAFMVGITPMSNVGYDFSDYGKDPDIIGVTNNYNCKYYGEGSVYQVFAAAGVTFWKRFSIGAEMMYWFGTIDKEVKNDFVDGSIRDMYKGSTILVRSITGKFGLQYEQPIGKTGRLSAGITYRMKGKMMGNTTNYNYAELSDIRDTVSYNVVNHKSGNLGIGDEIGVGLAFRAGERWSVEFDYLRSDWRKTNMGDPQAMGCRTDNFSTGISQSFRAGFEYVPNRNDIRYYMKRVAYRGGIYYDSEYYKFNGHNVTSSGITLGLTFPVFRFYNGVSLGVDIGRKGSLRSGMVRETYFTFSIGFNIHDLWFQKPRYN